MNSAFDMAGMLNDAQNLNAEGGLIAPTDYLSPNSFGPILGQNEHPKLDKKGRVYGKVVMCDRCRARNKTLYKVGERRYCKNCKIEMEKGEP